MAGCKAWPHMFFMLPHTPASILPLASQTRAAFLAYLEEAKNFFLALTARLQQRLGDAGFPPGAPCLPPPCCVLRLATDACQSLTPAAALRRPSLLPRSPGGAAVG